MTLTWASVHQVDLTLESNIDKGKKIDALGMLHPSFEALK